jgi:hypothetical protein
MQHFSTSCLLVRLECISSDHQKGRAYTLRCQICMSIRGLCTSIDDATRATKDRSVASIGHGLIDTPIFVSRRGARNGDIADLSGKPLSISIRQSPI